MRAKKGLEILSFWTEILIVLFVILGAITGHSIKSRIISYIVLFLFGVLSGTLIYNNRKTHFIRHTILAICFSAGFILSTGGGIMPLAGVFIAGNLAIYQALERKLIKII